MFFVYFQRLRDVCFRLLRHTQIKRRFAADLKTTPNQTKSKMSKFELLQSFISSFSLTELEQLKEIITEEIAKKREESSNLKIEIERILNDSDYEPELDIKTKYYEPENDIKTRYYEPEVNIETAESSFETETEPEIHECRVILKKLTSSQLLEFKKIYPEKLKQQTDENDLKCRFCGKILSSKSGKIDHERNFHTGEKPHKCQFCDLRFVYPKQKERHTDKVHTGRKYGCQYCDLKFIDKHDKNRHERIHTGKMPFECKICKKKFNDPRTKMKHEQGHVDEGIKLEQGPKEEGKISKIKHEKGLAKEGEKLLKKIKKFKCRICKKRFTNDKRRLKHEETHDDFWRARPRR